MINTNEMMPTGATRHASNAARAQAGVRTVRHLSGPQHRYYRAYFWQKILSDTAQKPDTRTEELNW